MVLLFALALHGATPAWGLDYGTTPRPDGVSYRHPRSAAEGTTPSGQGGFVRALDARTTPAGIAVHKFHFGFFQQDAFVGDYENHRLIEGGYSLTLSPAVPGFSAAYARLLNRTEWAVGWEARRDTTRIEHPNRRAQDLTNESLGDFSLGAKIALREGDRWTASAAFRARALAPEGTGFVDPATFSPDLMVLNSLSFDRFRLHFNAGYRLDNTIEVFDVAANDPAPSRSTRLSRGVLTEDSFLLGAAVESDLGRRLTAFLEGFMYYDEDGRALDSRGRIVDIGFGGNPIWLTPGVRAQVTRRVLGEVAADLGVLSGDFPGEDEVVPAWRILIGISFLGFPAEVLREAAPTVVAPTPAIVAPAPAPPSVIPAEAGIQSSLPTVEPPAVEVTKEKIVISETIGFTTGQMEILPESFPVLDAVAGALRQHPEIRVKVEGHTDSLGNPATNLRVSQARAEAVAKYLVEKGIDASRLEAKGYGDTAPISDNSTVEGRMVNRRVQFTIVEAGR
ncbi:MAG: OmpA family protein [Nitrospirae bacterium]|nr:OmpA family protein [Nitrospirota bacterium]